MEAQRPNAEASNSYHLPTVHLLVMGLTGTGKSTFIARATGDDSIQTGEGLKGVTTDVMSYSMVYKGFEVHLIDSPGFDDSAMSDHEVLKKIADFINNVHSLRWTIGGILYLHDITRTRMSGVGELNIRVLEKLTGREKWNNITLITNKWNCSASPEGELQRERELKENESFWKAMREAQYPARMCRFNNTKESALEIIDWHIYKDFTPAISHQMVDNAGPKLSLGDTDAGRVIRDKYNEIFNLNGMTNELTRMNEVMHHRFDGIQVRQTMSKLLTDLHELERKNLLQRAGRWVVRLTMIGGAVMATVLTENPAAFKAALTIAGPLEMSFRKQKTMTANKIAEMRESIASTALYGGLGHSPKDSLTGGPQVTELMDE